MSNNACRHVMCHEIGQTLRLGHTSTDGSSQGICMDYTGNDPASMYPSNNDYSVLQGVYDHADTGRLWDPHSLDSWKHKYLIPRTTEKVKTTECSQTIGSSRTRDQAIKPTICLRKCVSATRLTMVYPQKPRRLRVASTRR
jgi:hypothetical protein